MKKPPIKQGAMDWSFLLDRVRHISSYFDFYSFGQGYVDYANITAGILDSLRRLGEVIIIYKV